MTAVNGKSSTGLRGIRNSSFVETFVSPASMPAARCARSVRPDTRSDNAGQLTKLIGGFNRRAAEIRNCFDDVRYVAQRLRGAGEGDGKSARPRPSPGHYSRLLLWMD